MKRTIVSLLAAGLVGFGLIQLVHPAIPETPARAEIQAPPEVRRVLEKDCYSCHSDQRRLSWFDQIEPAYWLVRKDVLDARSHLNFSTLGEKPAAVQKATLYEAVTMMQLGAMPLQRFTRLHAEAKVTPEDLKTLQNYLSPWSSPPPLADSATTPVTAERIPLTMVSDTLNGQKFDGDFENWKFIAMTDRGDNNQFRLVLGNDIAMKAAREGHIKPWPDGARFAKVAWMQQRTPDGLTMPAKFWQVELMVKDAKGAAATEGWGWGRWRGLDLKPYGKDAAVVNECTGCHMPVKDNDYVYTQPVTAAHVEGSEIVNNLAAKLPASLPYQPLDWNPITLFLDPKTNTTSVLFANGPAFAAVRSQGNSVSAPVYPAGAKIALVTWTERGDPHWFGARVADTPTAVEFVEIGAAGSTPVYSRFDGGTGKAVASAGGMQSRLDFILKLPPLELP